MRLLRSGGSGTRAGLPPKSPSCLRGRMNFAEHNCTPRPPRCIRALRSLASRRQHTSSASPTAACLRPNTRLIIRPWCRELSSFLPVRHTLSPLFPLREQRDVADLQPRRKGPICPPHGAGRGRIRRLPAASDVACSGPAGTQGRRHSPRVRQIIYKCLSISARCKALSGKCKVAVAEAGPERKFIKPTKMEASLVRGSTRGQNRPSAGLRRKRAQARTRAEARGEARERLICNRDTASAAAYHSTC